MRYVMKVEGMTCANCAKTVENTFELFEGIDCKVNVSAGRVIFNYDETKYSVLEIADIVRQAGYFPVLEVDKSNIDKHNHSTNSFKRDILISIILSVPLLWTMWHHLGATWMTPRLSMFLMQPLVQIILATPVQFYVGRIFYKGFIKNAKQRVYGMDALVVMGTTSAYFFSLYEWILSGKLWYNPMMDSMPELYFETSATIITIILIGNYFEHIAKSRTSDALVNLINLGAKEALVIRDSVEVVIPIEEVEKGDIVIVKANEKVPVDGIIIEGASYIDESMINGESIPLYKKENDEVIGGTINQGERILVKTTKVGSDTVLAKIIETVEEVSSTKPPIQRTADIISSIFVPVVLTIAIGTFITWYFFLSSDLYTAFEASIAVLVISCPCALGLATPTSILVGSGKAAEEGILYKGGEFFEVANKIDAVCFDKTGTLTIGKPQVTNYYGDDDSFDYLYSLEQESIHPLARAIVEYKTGIKFKVTDFENLDGLGLKGIINGKEVIAGSKVLIDELAIDVTSMAEEVSELTKEAKTIVYLVIENKLEAVLAIEDELKKTSKGAIQDLHNRGIETYMITGDRKEVATEIAKRVGIKYVYSEVMPVNKAQIVEEIRKSGKFVAFVGDGVNDAPALKAADVGIAMSSGSDIAIDSSDVTLMSHELSLVGKAIDISQATLKNIYQNFAWAFGYNIIAIPLAAMGRLDPMIAGFAMAFSDITVVLNALRLKGFKFKDIEVEDMIKVTVPDMSCGHCVMAIEKALKADELTGKVDLSTKTVELEEADLEAVTKAIEQAGYTVNK